MTLISLDKIERGFGDVDILTGASLRVEERERIGVVGDNGTGKTTLINILAGTDVPDRGSRNTRRDLRVAYAEQIPEMAHGTTILSYVQRGNGEFSTLEESIQKLEADLAASPQDEKLLEDYGHLQSVFEAGGGYDRNHLCEKVLTGIGFPKNDWQKDVAVLSGGERSRVALAALMTAPAELLILDEPTNHLDLEGIDFVANYIDRYPGAVLAISHDRHFLNAFAETIIEVDMGTATRFKGNYSAFTAQRDAKLLAEARAFKSQQAFIDKEMDYIRRNMAGRMSTQAKGRLKRIQRIQVLSGPKQKRGGMNLEFGSGGRGQSGQTMLEAIDLKIALPNNRVLVERGNFRLYHGDTIGILGRNGSGKTTMMRALAQRREVEGGAIEWAHGLKIGYFSQEVTDLPRGVTVINALRQLDTTVPEKELRDHLALFLFRGERVEDQVDNLSGGEKQRLSLARMTRSNYDLLCLDEPTNHLDITGREGLENALQSFPGSVLVISHDRQFLEAVTDKVLYLTDGTARPFDRGLKYSLSILAEERAERRTAEAAAKAKQKSLTEAAAPAPTHKPNKIRNPYMFQKLEAEIMDFETELEEVQASMLKSENYIDPKKMKAIAQREQALKADLADRYERWENWS